MNPLLSARKQANLTATQVNLTAPQVTLTAPQVSFTGPNRVNRRAVLRNGVLVLAALPLISLEDTFGSESAESLVFGLVTDLHYADKAPAGSRHYRETLAKLEEAGARFEQEQIAFLVELGDLIDAADSVEMEQSYLQRINRDFSAICKDRHYVLGNHCVDTLTKAEFLGGVEQEKSYYSFDRGNFHFVVLDACFRNDGQAYERKNFTWTDTNLPQDELEWLKADLTSTSKRVIVFAHQRLDVNDNHGVKNNVQVRQILESSHNVLAVFQGHSHQNALNNIGGIHYCTMRAMVEESGETNNGFSVIKIEPNGTIEVTGFQKQESYNWRTT